MPTYTVTEILKTKPWTPPGESEPRTVYYDVKLDGHDGPVNVGRKPTNPLAVGAVLEGAIVPDDRGGMKFNRAPGAFNGGGRGGRDPKESKRIAMQASHKVAVDILRLAAEVGTYQKPERVGEIVEQVKTIAKTLCAQVEEAGA